MSLDPRTLPLADYRPHPRLATAETVVERSALPAIDAHNHLGRWLSEDGGWVVRDVPALLELMDAVGVAAIVNLDGRWDGELEANLDRYDRAHPGRFATFCHVDFERELARGGDAGARLAASLERSAAAGARGLKVWKSLGLGFRDERGALVLPDDARLDALWDRAGALGLPVLIHTADPIAFFDPLDASNERLEELASHPDWWFGGPGNPSFWELMGSLERIVERHPRTVYIGAHVGCCAEDLGWVDGMLARFPNFNVDIGARLGELGRQPRAARRLIERHPDRVLFGTDAFPPDAETYRLHWRFLESADEHFAYAPGDEVGPQGRWRVSALDLTSELLDGVYQANARRLIAGLARPGETGSQD